MIGRQVQWYEKILSKNGLLKQIRLPETAVLLTQEAEELYEGDVELEDSAPEGVVEILRDPEIDEKAGVAGNSIIE